MHVCVPPSHMITHEPWCWVRGLQTFRSCDADVIVKCQLASAAAGDFIDSRASTSCIAMGLCGVASMIRVFGDERVQYWREASGLPQFRSVGHSQSP
jgi:hypothetical protein